MTVASRSLTAQVPQLEDGGVAMGHLHTLVSEADYDAHRRAWVEGLGARPATLGRLEVLLPGLSAVIKKGESAGGSEGTVVNHL